ncbi:unnamed protein product [Enterobius vermicularis]|uniref:Acetylcholine receptor subunit alpha-type unc-38 n=1 Tax=Enterobius vermicularis TaxID=51028 RepID=A0A0N4V1I0_ENTVE|nr:unnamed protein product [Enterobius vermicularis]
MIWMYYGFWMTAFVRYTAAVSSEIRKQLYEDLLFDYMKVPRPVKNTSVVLTVEVGASLIRLIDVDEKNQIMTTNLWLEMRWYDTRLTWEPKKYGGIRSLHIPSDFIWVPDFVLYNNAVGDPDITTVTNALVAYDGRVVWHPPAIYKSFCPIDVTWFPYDTQNCEMKFGIWTYTGYYIDLKQINKDQVKNETDKNGEEAEVVHVGMDLSFYYESAEWDLLSLSSAKHSKLYSNCCGPEKFVDITYFFTLRRKTLFFTCNLIVPCFLISSLTTFVFCLSRKKIDFAIHLLVTLTVFFLVLLEIMPPTSVVLPMLGRYLTTTMVLVTASTIVSVIVVNVRLRKGSSHTMSPWTRKIFLDLLPRLLIMRRPKIEKTEWKIGVQRVTEPPKLLNFQATSQSLRLERSNCEVEVPPRKYHSILVRSAQHHSSKKRKCHMWKPIRDQKFRELLFHKNLILKIYRQLHFIATYFECAEYESELSEEWVFVSMVMDRFFFIVFSILNIGSISIILEAPIFYEYHQPMNRSAPSKPLGQTYFS